ncbi:hypothetical protein PENTCL1PPCAC_2129, partial [Pristionchus entomophagus]
TSYSTLPTLFAKLCSRILVLDFSRHTLKPAPLRPLIYLSNNHNTRYTMGHYSIQRPLLLAKELAAGSGPPPPPPHRLFLTQHTHVRPSDEGKPAAFVLESPPQKAYDWQQLSQRVDISALESEHVARVFTPSMIVEKAALRVQTNPQGMKLLLLPNEGPPKF